MKTLSNLKLYDVDIEDIDTEIAGCSFFMDENHKSSQEPYNRYLQIIAKEVEVIEYDEKNNTATIDLSGFIDRNFNVLDEIFDIPCCDPVVEYLDVLVAMINGYESKHFYNTFCQAYEEGKFIKLLDDKNQEENIEADQDLISSILEKSSTFEELKDSLEEILDECLINDTQYDKLSDIIENDRRSFIIYVHDWKECCGGNSPQEYEYVENTVKELLEIIKQEEISKENEEEDCL